MEEAAVKKRPLISAKERGPGPGCYALPPTVGYIKHDVTKPTSPAYSFRTRMSSTMISVDSSPGPRYHVGANVTRFGRMNTPSYSMLGRGKRIVSKGDKFQTPGPGAYSPEKAPPLNAQHRSPAYTIGTRTRYRSVDAVPAPNSYVLPKLLGNQVPNKPSGVSYSMSARRMPGGPSEDLAQSPGPGRYNSTDPDVYLQRQPSFSMQSRTKRLTYPSTTPGPGTYRPEGSGAHLRRAPSFTMGVRHSEFVTPLVLDFVH
ncbi:outer dense fiber protein 3-like protein 2a [Corythoichthys intestinalis]|uniref:outer dense fiber protein 3-like protein 2a n=1 Tax=Corythoichthys intestinalis TaxID=161448 RepID=UPI0025A5204A|nr:outer dense fiber protein 3-like protein 2a [Corythoichthys intestinalis]XP_061798892.1 protein CIMAP1D-like [Nerophis lumbriciformis]